MKRLAWGLIVMALILGILVGGYWWFSARRHIPAKSPAPLQDRKGVGPVASVKTVPLEIGNISEDITVYGKVIPAPGATQAVSVPFQSHVRHIMVNNGQKVSRGDVLLKIEPSPDTHLLFSQAYASYESTKQALQNTQQRFDLKLATNDQLLKAKLAFEQAQLRLESMKHQGIEGEQDIWADVGGLIKKVYVEEGAIVPAGNPLVEIVAQNRLEVRLGVETEDIGKVQPKQSVLLTQVNVSKSPAVSGQIRQISYAVNPSTRLVDVFVTLPLSAGFVLGESVLGKIAVSSSRGLIVPRSAVLPEGDTYILFTVKNGRGVKHVVQLGLQSEKEVEVIGTGLQPGEPVVILGNYELKDGMAAKVEDPQ